MLREEEIAENYAAWIDPEQKIISFSEIEDYEKLTFATYQERLNFVIKKGYSGFRIR